MASTKKGVDVSSTKPSDVKTTDGLGNAILAANTPAAEAEEPKKKITTTFEGTMVTWNIPGDDGDKPTVDVLTLPSHIQDHARLHGVSAKVTDSAALKKGATMAEKKAAIVATIANLKNGKWNADRSEPMGDGALMAAINEHRVSEKKPPMFADVPTFQKWATDGAAANKCSILQFIAGMEANPKIKPIVERIRLEKLKSVTFDSDAFLA